jgi:hypothetical protein
MSDNTWETDFAQLWMEVLGVDTADEHDDFFDLGGHSLSALRLSTLIRQDLDRDVQLNHVLENPRYADLLAVTGRAPSISSAEAASATGGPA